MIFRPYMVIPAQIVPFKTWPKWMKNRGRYVRERRQYLGSRSLDRIFPRRPLTSERITP